jgi:hypothetical protein
LQKSKSHAEWLFVMMANHWPPKGHRAHPVRGT